MNFVVFGIVSILILNGILLYKRQSSWVKNQYKWITVLLLFLIGSITIFLHRSQNFDVNLLFAAFMTPAIFSAVDNGFERLSFLIHNRRLYLWLRWSADVDDLNIKFKASDRIFSVLLLYMNFALLVLSMILLKKYT